MDTGTTIALTLSIINTLAIIGLIFYETHKTCGDCKGKKEWKRIIKSDERCEKCQAKEDRKIEI